MSSLQMSFRLAKYTLEPANLGGDHISSQSSQSIITTTRILIRAVRGFLDQFLIEQLLQVVIKSSWTELVVAAGLSLNFLHDAVAMTVFTSQSKEDVKDRWRQR